MRRKDLLSKSAILAGILVLAILAAFSSFVPWTQGAEAQEPFILKVSVQDEMKTRNAIRFNFFTGDVWTADVMLPVFGGTIVEHPETLDRLPYVMVGTDKNGNGALDAAEVGVFAPEDSNTDFWTAFYDVTGLRFHDGTQVGMLDVLIGYHLEALAPGGDRFMKDLAGGPGTNYTADRYLHINPVTIADWMGAAPNANQFAFRFKQTGPNAEFDRSSLQTVILPAYFWQGTGVRKVDGQVVATAIHPDFGQIINPATMNGVPVGGVGGLREYDITAASEWDAQDADVIGTGPFRFVTWLPGHVARIDKNGDYFVPNYPATVAAGLRVPALDAIVYRLFRNVQAGVFALQAGDVDFLDWFVPPEFVGTLLSDPKVGIITSADAGYFYIGYNMRRLPFGYTDPIQGSNLPDNDRGRPFRLAAAHAIDKGTIVQSLLQNFGIPGHTVVSPTNTLYYNASAPRYPFDLAQADSILDAAYGDWDPAINGTCDRSGAGCRNLPGKGTALFEILTPQADYDPIRAAAGALIAQNLRQIGINVDSRPTAFGRIVVKVFMEQDFDIFILDWSLTGFIVPSYIESFMHSRNTVLDGNNPQGYVNASLDAIIDAAEGATSQADSVRLWKQAQGIVAIDLPTDVLYFRTNIFGFRQDRIDPDSWRTDIGGDIYWFWSRILLDPAPAGLIRTSAVAPSALASGGTADVVVTVRDADKNPLSGVTVDVSVSSGPGSISPASGTTDANGQFTTTFTGPTLAPTDTQVVSFIEIRATHPTLGSALTISLVITTFPPGVSFLALLVDTPFGNAVDEGASTILDVSVTDETGLAAEGASVILTPSPTATLTPSSFTTGASGRESVTFTAPEVTADTSYTITVTASRQGVEGQSQIMVIVLDVAPDTMNPTVWITSPADGAMLTSTLVTVTGTASDDVAVDKVELSTDGMTWILATGTASWSGIVTLAEGPNTIFARATDTAGNTAGVNIAVTVDTVRPTAIAGEDQTVAPGATASFDASASSDDVAIVSYEWDFGDGTTGTGKTATHIFTDPGTYMVTLTVRDAAGNADTDVLIITVKTEPVNPIPPEVVTFGVVGAIAAAAAGVALLLWRRRAGGKEKA